MSAEVHWSMLDRTTSPILLIFLQPEVKFLVMLYGCIRFCPLWLTLGRDPLRNLILVCSSQCRWLNAIGQEKAPLIGWPCLEHIIRTESRAQVRPTCSILEPYEPRREPQVNLSLLRSNSLKFQPQLNVMEVFEWCTLDKCTKVDKLKWEKHCFSNLLYWPATFVWAGAHWGLPLTLSGVTRRPRGHHPGVAGQADGRARWGADRIWARQTGAGNLVSVLRIWGLQQIKLKCDFYQYLLRFKRQAVWNMCFV